MDSLIMDEEYKSMLEKARKCACDVGKKYMNRYQKNPLFKSLFQNPTTFMNYTEFHNGLTSDLFWTLKKENIWKQLDDEDWDMLCNLAMESALKRFQAIMRVEFFIDMLKIIIAR